MPTLTIWVGDYYAILFPLGEDDGGGGREAATLTEPIRCARCYSKHSACRDWINPHNCPSGGFYCQGGNRGAYHAGEELRQTAFCS